MCFNSRYINKVLTIYGENYIRYKNFNSFLREHYFQSVNFLNITVLLNSIIFINFINRTNL